ncbi:MAG: AAC(3) family N-acetyltransferase [Clostridiales bacterium]|nr:AAC(3) family N-acetyltransferase [Clostridiales bacterium]
MNKSDIIEGLRSLGLCRGMNIIVHSSLSSLGYVEGGADTVLEALTEIITSDGTILMPSFNHNAPYDRGEMFDIRSTPSVCGAITEALRRYEGSERSMNPTHSFVAWGKNAIRYTRDHQRYDCMGENSPLHRLMQDDGYCLLLGVGYNRNTFHHCVETLEKAGCISKRGEVYPVINERGEMEHAYTWGWRGKPCPINDRTLYSAEMEKIHRRAKIGEATVTFYRLREGYEVIAKCLREGYGGNTPCPECKILPRVCQYTVDV